MGAGQTVGAAVAVAALGALVVWRRPVFAFGVRTAAFINQVRGEIKKVTWPTSLDLRKSTTIIVIFVIISGVVIGIMDWAFSKILIDFLGQVFA